MQSSEKEIGKLHSRLQGMETRQQQMMSFLSKALQNPQFLQQVLSAHQPSRLTSGQLPLYKIEYNLFASAFGRPLPTANNCQVQALKLAQIFNLRLFAGKL